MNSEGVIALFREAGALLEGHFLYTSGRHGKQFLQAARVMQYPDKAEALCRAIAERFADDGVEMVVGPATGAIVMAHETARALGCRAGYSEKDGEGGMALKRGLSVAPGTRVLVVEDITTTGGSVKKTVAHMRERGAEVVGVAVLIDRSAGEANFDCRFEPLAKLDMESWEPGECPLCAGGERLVEPDDLVG